MREIQIAQNKTLKLTNVLARKIEAAGWSHVRWRNLTGGIVALHAAVKP